MKFQSFFWTSYFLGSLFRAQIPFQNDDGSDDEKKRVWRLLGQRWWRLTTTATITILLLHVGGLLRGIYSHFFHWTRFELENFKIIHYLVLIIKNSKYITIWSPPIAFWYTMPLNYLSIYDLLPQQKHLLPQQRARTEDQTKLPNLLFEIDVRFLNKINQD